MDQHNQSSAADLLWQWVTEVYARPGVAEACLALQDAHGADVNLLLYSAWRMQSGPLSGDEARALDALCRPWREAVIEPLRQQRRAWKDKPGLEEEYRGLKMLELAAEREQLRRLSAWSYTPEGVKGGSATTANTLSDSLLAVLQINDADASPAMLEPLLRALRLKA